MTECTWILTVRQCADARRPYFLQACVDGCREGRMPLMLCTIQSRAFLMMTAGQRVLEISGFVGTGEGTYNNNFAFQIAGKVYTVTACAA